MLAAGCSKKVAVGPPPPPAPAAATPAVTSRPAAAPARAAVTPRPTAPTPAPPSRYPNAATRARINELLAKIEDAYFDYDRSALRPDALSTLQADSTELRDILKD